MFLRIVLAAVCLFTLSIEVSAQVESSMEVMKLERGIATVYIMHRRNAGTLQEYYDVGYNDEVEYPLRDKNPMFRVYTIGLGGGIGTVSKILLQSFRGKKLLDTYSPMAREANGRISFVDQYVSTKEDRVVVKVLMHSEESMGEWSFTVRFK